MASTQPAALLMSMSDIAALARVQRPVVSVWRTRTAGTAHPFPQPVSHSGSRQLFDAYEVGRWLTESKHGNNPDASADAAAHAAIERTTHTEDVMFNAVTGLLALRSQLGITLESLHEDRSPTTTSGPATASAGDARFLAAVLDAADENDPDDDCFYREIEALGDALAPAASYVDALVESAYGEAPAFERLLADRSKRDATTYGSTILARGALDLMAQTATSLADPHAHEPMFVDVTGSASDIVLAIARTERVTSDLIVLTANDDSAASRLLRRRLLVHGIQRRGLPADEAGSFTVTGPAVHVAQFPPAHRPAMTPIEILEAIDLVVLGMTDEQTAVILAPASVLTDALSDTGADALRSAILRSRRLRAVVRLPAGLLTHKPQQAQALWVFAAAHENVPLADLWTLAADLTETPLDPTAIHDLVSDLVASLGDSDIARSHAFSFARLVPTRALLASRKSLVASARVMSGRADRSGAEIAVRIDALLSSLSTTQPNTQVSATDAVARLQDITVEPAVSDPTSESPNAAVLATVDQLLGRGHLEYVPGNRLDVDDIEGDSGVDRPGGFRVIGPAELAGDSALGSRRLDSIRFVTAYPSGRLTEPGDIVFCTSPRPSAILDAEGASVVVYPARILRINPAKPNGLQAEVVADDITALPSGNRRWRRWELRRVRHTQWPALTESLAAIRSQQGIARERLSQLDELASLLIAGTTAGTITVTTHSLFSHPRPIAEESLAPSEGSA